MIASIVFRIRSGTAGCIGFTN